MLSFKKIPIDTTTYIQISPFCLTLCFSGDDEHWERCQSLAEERIRWWFEDESATLIAEAGDKTEEGRHALLHDMLTLQEAQSVCAPLIKPHARSVHLSMDSHLFLPPHLIESVFQDWWEQGLLTQRQHHQMMSALLPSLFEDRADNFYDLCSEAYQHGDDEESMIRQGEMACYLKQSASTYFDVTEEEAETAPGVSQALKQQFVDHQRERYTSVLKGITSQYAESHAEKERLKQAHQHHGLLKAIEKVDYLLVLSDILENTVRILYSMHKLLINSLFHVTETFPVIGALVQGVGYLASPAKYFLQKNKKKKVNKLSMGLKVLTGAAMTGCAIAGLLIPPLGLTMATVALGASIGVSVYKHQRTRGKLARAHQALSRSTSVSSLSSENSQTSRSSQEHHEHTASVSHYQKKYKKRTIETGLLTVTTGLLAVSILCPPAAVPCVAAIAVMNVAYLGYKAWSWGKACWGRSSSSVAAQKPAPHLSRVQSDTIRAQDSQDECAEPAVLSFDSGSDSSTDSQRATLSVSSLSSSVGAAKKSAPQLSRVQSDTIRAQDSQDECAEPIVLSFDSVSDLSTDSQRSTLSVSSLSSSRHSHDDGVSQQDAVDATTPLSNSPSISDDPASVSSSPTPAIKAADATMHAIERLEARCVSKHTKTYAECHAAPSSPSAAPHHQPEATIEAVTAEKEEAPVSDAPVHLSSGSERCLNREFSSLLHSPVLRPDTTNKLKQQDESDGERDGEREREGEREGERDGEGDGGSTLHL